MNAFARGEISASVRRHATPVKPVLAHEAVHYIDIPDYAVLNRKFDAFAARVGQAFLAHIDRLDIAASHVRGRIHRLADRLDGGSALTTTPLRIPEAAEVPTPMIST